MYHGWKRPLFLGNTGNSLAETKPALRVWPRRPLWPPWMLQTTLLGPSVDFHANFAAISPREGGMRPSWLHATSGCCCCPTSWSGCTRWSRSSDWTWSEQQPRSEPDPASIFILSFSLKVLNRWRIIIARQNNLFSGWNLQNTFPWMPH